MRTDKRKGGDNTGKVYRLSCGTFEQSMRQLLRFYCLHKGVTEDQMSAASCKAWSACESVMTRLPKREKELVDEYFSVSAEDKQSLFRWYETQHRLSHDYVNEVIRKACHLVAIEMGIADRKGGDEDDEI